MSSFRSHLWLALVSVGNRVHEAFTGKHALLYNTMSGSVLFASGDAIQQHLEVKHGIIPKFDYRRNFRVGMIGIIEGPPHFLFYKYLEIYFPGRGRWSIFYKIFIDQFIACPSFHFLYFMGMSLMEGKTWAASWRELVYKFPTVYTVDWILWPPLQVINFYFISPTYRVVVINGLTVVWNVFLSYMKHYDQFDNRECCKKKICTCRGPNYKGETGENQIFAFIKLIFNKHGTKDGDSAGSTSTSTSTTSSSTALPISPLTSTSGGGGSKKVDDTTTTTKPSVTDKAGDKK